MPLGPAFRSRSPRHAPPGSSLHGPPPARRAGRRRTTSHSVRQRQPVANPPRTTPLASAHVARANNPVEASGITGERESWSWAVSPESPRVLARACAPSRALPWSTTALSRPGTRYGMHFFSPCQGTPIFMSLLSHSREAASVCVCALQLHATALSVCAGWPDDPVRCWHMAFRNGVGRGVGGRCGVPTPSRRPRRQAGGRTDLSPPSRRRRHRRRRRRWAAPARGGCGMPVTV
jgi:hypothetical protein